MLKLNLILTLFLNLFFISPGESSLYASQNLVEQSCTQVLEQRLVVVNENGKCTATWTCDAKNLSVQCENTECKCFDGDQYYNVSSYPGCDSSKLSICFTK